MRQISKIVILTGLFLALAACAPKDEKKKVGIKAKPTAQTPNGDAGKTGGDGATGGGTTPPPPVAQPGKAGEVPAPAPQAQGELDPQVIIPGGKAGSISLSGGLIRDPSLDLAGLADGITVKQENGLNSKGLPSEVSKDARPFNKDISESQIKVLEQLQENKNYINVGCTDIEFDKSKEPIELKDIKSELKAHTVYLCDANLLKLAMPSIIGKEVVLKNFNYKMVGGGDKNISILADTLILEGDNVITSQGIDGAKDIAQGPMITIASHLSLSGQGTLKIIAKGGNFKKGESSDTSASTQPERKPQH